MRISGRACDNVRMTPAALLLDLDGTLVDSETFHTESIVRFLAKRGLELTDSERAFIVGHAWQDIFAHLQVATRLGMSLEDLQRGSIAQKPQMVEDGHRINVLPGARALVAWGAAAQIPMAIVSGSSRGEIAYALTLLGFEDELQFYMGAEDVRCGKPNPEGYASAANRLNVDPARCVVFEDSTAGIASGRAAGMFVVATSAANLPESHAGHQDQSQAHMVVSGLDALDLDELAGLA